MTYSSSYPNNSGQPRQQQQHNGPQHQQMSSSSPPRNPIASPVVSKQASLIDENLIVMDYKPPGIIPSPDRVNPCFDKSSSNDPSNNPLANKKVQWVYNPADGSVLKDHNGLPLSVARLLATKPLRHELSTRPGPGNKKLTYISGDDVSRTLNDVFGFDGWSLEILDVSRVDASRDPKTGKHTIVYTARVRVTHKASGAYKEDCGAGDSTDRVYATAIAHALKASITDAMKRAARHFGDKLGNSLYAGNFSISKAPVSLKDALDKYDIHRCNTKFGFQKPSVTNATSSPSKSTNTSATSSSASFYQPPKGSMPPPTVPSHSSRQKEHHEQQQQRSGMPLNNASSLTNSNAGNDKNKKAEQYQNQKHRQSKYQQQNPQNQPQPQFQQQGIDTKNQHKGIPLNNASSIDPIVGNDKNNTAQQYQNQNDNHRQSQHQQQRPQNQNQQQFQQQCIDTTNQHKGIPLNNASSIDPIVGNEKNNTAQQYHNQNNRQLQQQRPHPQNQQHQLQQQQGIDTKNPYSSTITGPSNPHQQKQNHQSYSTNSHQTNYSGSSNNHQHQQKQSTNSNAGFSDRTLPHQSKEQMGSSSTGMPTSTVARPTSSYGPRPALESNKSITTNHSGSGSNNVGSSENCATTMIVNTGPPYNPNTNNSNSRRISLDWNNQQQQHQHQPTSTDTPHSSTSNVNTNVHMVSQTPSIHGGGGNYYSNQQHKRPPLSTISHNPTAIGFSSESSAKRPKQQRHHNPYNQPHSGRKSI